MSARANSDHHDLEDVIDCIIAMAEEHKPDAQGRVSVADFMDALGARSFGPLLLVPSLIAVSPAGAIPGLPAFTSVVIVLIAAQILLGHKYFWLPGWLRRRAMDAGKLRKGLQRIRPVAHFIDHLLRPRLVMLTRGPFLYVIALMCLLVGLVTPVLELVPLGGIPPNAAVVAFSLALTARDGLWAILALGFTAASVALLVMGLL